MAEWPKYRSRNARIISMLEEGESISHIAKTLHVNKSTVSYYAEKHGCKHSIRVKNRISRNARIIGRRNANAARQRRQQWQEIGWNEATGEPIHIAGCMLHWAEGSKHSRNSVRFCNTDPDMLKFYIRFLKHIGVSKRRIKWCCRTHKDGLPLSNVEDYWKRHLGLIKSNMTSGSVETRSKRKNKDYNHGICYLILHDTTVTQRIYGAIGRYAGIDTSCWL